MLRDMSARNLQEHNIASHKHNGPPHATCWFNLIKVKFVSSIIWEPYPFISTNFSLRSNNQSRCKILGEEFQCQKQLKKQFHSFGQVHKLCLVSTKIAIVLESKSKVKEQPLKAKILYPRLTHKMVNFRTREEISHQTLPSPPPNSLIVYKMVLDFLVHKLLKTSTN